MQVPFAGTWDFDTDQPEDEIQLHGSMYTKYPVSQITGAEFIDIAWPYLDTEDKKTAEVQIITAQTSTISDFAVYYFISDHLGTAQLLVDESKKIVWQGNYSPFGTVDVVVNTLDNKFRFPGQYFDAETGLHYNWNRYYDPATGRYITADPIGLEGGMNLYAYVGGNPVNYYDSTGLTESDGSGLWGGGLDDPPSRRPPGGPFGTKCGAENSKLARWIPDITPNACQRHDDCYDNCARNCYGMWCKTACDLQLGMSNPVYGGATFWRGKSAYEAAKEKHGCGECNE